jgi:PIN domain nuclease of toxin-antitoxin system
LNRPPVLDASAALCFLNNEPGAEIVERMLGRAIICSVNLAEVVSKLTEHGNSADWIRQDMARLQTRMRVVDFDIDLAWRAGLLRATTRHLGLSLGDRACLALAEREGGVAVTCDRAWREVAGVAVELVRP